MLAAAITLASPLAPQATAAQQIDSLAIVRFKLYGANDGRSGALAALISGAVGCSGDDCIAGSERSQGHLQNALQNGS